MYKVESGVPMPRRRRKFPYDLMEVGDSFVAGKEAVGSVKSTSSYAFKTTGKKFTSRVNPDGTIRCWRVA